ncbi:hypothetical protein D210916BOD24_27330 [Alteromonas sp. D210916BOD_24]|uniref:hypothetical protein n=1 Tax=Alteromonas sp. D210916BOD_24 TaxID=3157618 RepID=UPI00399D077A
MPSPISLVTGIPRSGTTLACKLLNGVDNVIALHEPLDPQKLAASQGKEVIPEIKSNIAHIYRSLLAGKDIEHGDSANLVLDNPVSQSSSNDTPIRATRAKRGLLSIPAITPNTHVFIKQNAMFAALVNELKAEYPLVAIVRNPIDVLTSWMTVNLPVNRGRIPGGEKFCPPLSETLNGINDVVARQVTIYHWFLSQFIASGVPILKYEDIIATKGLALFKACQVNGTPDNALFPRHAYRPELTAPLTWVAEHLNYALLAPYYSTHDIAHSLAQTTANGSPN